MQSRITKLTAAAVLALAVLLLARHLTGRERPVAPAERNALIAKSPDNQEVSAPVLTAQEKKLAQLAHELDFARELFAAADAKGLLQLLDTGLDQTKITVAGYLGQMKEESAVPALQWLAERWQGPAEDNPFRKSIEQIRNASQREGTADESRTPAAIGYDPRIIVRVSDKAAGAPIASAEIQIHNYHRTDEAENRTQGTDEKGVFILDLTGFAPEYTRIVVHSPGYVPLYVQYWGVCAQSLPKTVRFPLEKGTLVGGIVQDTVGQPVKGASVKLSFDVDQAETAGEPHVFETIQTTTDEQGRWRSSEIPALIGDIRFDVEHPEFANAQFQMPRELTLEDLRAERAVMVLNRGVTVVGRVTGASGTPIVGAGLLAGYSYHDYEWAQTDETGRFSLELRQARTLGGKFYLTVQAAGFAPQRKELPHSEDLGPVDFTLQPARRLIGRIVDSDDRPLADVSVVANEWNGYNTIKWHGKTDPNGIFTWDYPPADAIQMYLSKPGYLQSWPKVVADGQEHTFVLAKSMVILGSVTDSRTGKPIPRFRVTPGSRSDRDGPVRWLTSALYLTKWFTAGHYSYPMPSPGQAYAVRVEADGYLSQESRVVDVNEQAVTIDITLTPGQESRREEEDHGPSGYVFDADASPVAGVQVFWGQTVQIYDGRGEVHGRVCTTTDGEGHFAFNAPDREDLLRTDNGQAPFLAVCDRGIGGASCEELARNGFIMLKAWARVEGQWRIGNRPARNQELSLWFWHDQALSQADFDTTETVTDENGGFVFEKVYPGKFTLHNEIFWATPGRTLNVLVGGDGRIVKGELIVPSSPDTAIRVGLTVVPANVPIPFDKIPKPPGYERMSFDEVRTWLERFSDSPEDEAYSKWLSQTDARSFKHLRVDMDDGCRFHVDNVEPGAYILRGEVKTGGLYDGRMMGVAPGQEHLLSKLIGSVWHEFEVPPLASDSELDVPLDLGTLPVRTVTKPQPGDPAPDFDLPTFGEGRIRLADYRGKVVLVTFFMANCLRTYPQGLEELKSVYQQFHEDARYAQIGLFFESYPLLAKKAVDEAELSWPHGVIWEHSGREIREYSGPSKMLWNVVIDAQGRIFAKDLSGEALESAIDAALQTVRRRPWSDR